MILTKSQIKINFMFMLVNRKNTYWKWPCGAVWRKLNYIKVDKNKIILLLKTISLNHLINTFFCQTVKHLVFSQLLNQSLRHFE